MTAEGYKTFINGSVMASFMEGIVASILEEKSGAGYGTNCSQLNTVISVIEAMYLCEGTYKRFRWEQTARPVFDEVGGRWVVK